jgi:predicted ATPase
MIRPMSSTPDPVFASVVRGLRIAAGLAQEDLAARLFVSRKSVQRWERGLGVPDEHAERLLRDVCDEHRLFARTTNELAVAGVTGWADVAGSLARARAVRPPRGRPRLPITDLVARDEEIAALRTLLTPGRLVTVIGPGGVGKTSVASAVAAGWAPARVVVVELAEVSSTDLVLEAIASRLPDAPDPRTSIRSAVVGALATVDLLVLDNLEHLPDAPPIVADVSASCPRLAVLVTSRSPLGIAGERVFPLQPLSLDATRPHARQLFERCALAATGGDLALDAPARPTIDAICRKLDGLPLAIELAASRLRAMSIEDLAARLDRPLRLAAGGGEHRPGRHRSLDACIDWSYQLLPAGAAALLGQLGAFVGGWTLAVAERLAGADAIDRTAELVDSGLVQRSGGRYRMSEAVREFVTSRETGGSSALIDWAIAHAASFDTAARGPDADPLVTGFDDEWSNLRAALGACLGYADARRGARLCLALTAAWDARSMLRDAAHWIELTLALDHDDAIAAALRTWLGYFTAMQGEFDRAARHGAAALAVFERLAIDGGVGYACLILGRVAAETGRLDDADALLRRSEAALRTAGDRWGLVRPVNALGELARERGDLALALRQHHAALELARELGDLGSLPSILADVANVAADLGHADDARRHAEEAVAIATRRANPAGVAAGLDALGRALCRLGDTEAALDVWAESSALRADIHHPVERRDRAALDRDRELATSTARAAGASSRPPRHRGG